METLWLGMNYWGQDVFIDISHLQFHGRYLPGRRVCLFLALGDPALGDHVELLCPLVDRVLGRVVDLGVGPHLLHVRHAGTQVAVVVVVQPGLDRRQVHWACHNLNIINIIG